MATIHVNRAGTSLGTFSEEDVRQGLRAGRLLGSDLAWEEGMASWQPLSSFTRFAADLEAAPAPSAAAAPPPETAPPGAVPPPPVAAGVTGPIATAGARTGLPWENRNGRGWFNAFVETLQMVLSRPNEAFGLMKTEGGLGDPMIYLLIGGCAGAAVSFLVSFGLQGMGWSLGNKNAFGNAFGNMVGVGIGSLVFLIFIPFMVVIGQFIGSAIMHVCLMIVGGANRPFETTFRVLAFSQGSTGVLQMIPVCGGAIAAIWGIVVNCIGLARAHETDTWRGVLAVFLPIIVCGGCVVVAIMLGVMGALSQHSSS